MNELRIVLDLSEDTKALLTGLLNSLKPNCSGCVETVVNSVEAALAPEQKSEESEAPKRKSRKSKESEAPKAVEESPVVESPAPVEESPAPAVEPPKVVTLKDVQSAVTKACQNGKRDGAKAIVEKYAARVSAIPEDKFAEVLEALEAL